MAETVEVRLVAKDTGTVSVFRASGQAAERMGDQVEQAGKRGSEGMRDASRGASDLGKALGALTIVGVKMAADQERLAYALKRNYGDAADEFQAFADQVQNTTIFSDDQVIEGANAAAQLARNFQFTNEQIQTVIATAADLASLYGTDLASAVDRVVAGLRGEAESAEMLGLSLGDNSIMTSKVASSLNETEKAQLRYIALTEQATYATGAAAAVAAQDGQRWHQWANTAQDALQGVGAELSAFQGPLLALAGATQVLGPLASGLKTAGAAAKEAQLGTAALSLATGPVGMVAAVAAGAAGIYYLTQRQSEAEQQAHALASATTEYTGTIQSMTTALVNAGAFQVVEATRQELEGMVVNGQIAAERVDDVSQAMTSLRMSGLELEGADLGTITAGMSEGMDEYTVAIIRAADANGDSLFTAQELAAAQAVLASGFVLTTEQASNLTAAVGQLTDDIANPELAGGELAIAVKGIMDDIADGTLTVQQGIDALNAIETSGLDDYNLALRAANDQQADLATTATLTSGALDSQIIVLNGNTQAYTENAIAIAMVKQQRRGEAMDVALATDAYTENQVALAAAKRERQGLEQDAYWANERQEIYLTSAAYDEWRVKNEGRGKEQDQYVADHPEVGALPQVAAATGDLADASARLAQWQREDAAAAAEHEAALLSEMQALEGFARSMANAASTGAALDATFGVIVDGSNALGAGTEKAQKWADALIAPIGTVSEMDRLLGEHQITQQEYNAAQQAQTDIAYNNAEAQDALMQIQIQQAPVVAEMVRQQKEYAEGVAGLPADQQLLALAYADTATQAQAMDIATQIAAASAGELGDKGMAATQALVAGAAEASPALRAVLDDMGAIEVGADGTVTVNFAGDGKSETEALIDSIDALTIAMGGVPPFTPEVDTGPARQGISDVTAQIYAWGGISESATAGVDNSDAAFGFRFANEWAAAFGSLSVNATAGVVDNASGTLGAIGQALLNLDGFVATTYVNTVATGTTGGFATGGVVTGYASGGVVIRGGEHGPERITSPSGMRAILPRDGLYEVERGSYVTPAGATARDAGGGGGGLTVNVHVGNVNGSMDGMVEDLARVFGGAMESALSQRYASLGAG